MTATRNNTSLQENSFRHLLAIELTILLPIIMAVVLILSLLDHSKYFLTAKRASCLGHGTRSWRAGTGTWPLSIEEASVDDLPFPAYAGNREEIRRDAWVTPFVYVPVEKDGLCGRIISTGPKGFIHETLLLQPRTYEWHITLPYCKTQRTAPDITTNNLRKCGSCQGKP